MMNILVTGGTGFIGRNIVEKLSTKYNIFAPSRRELNLLSENDVQKYINNHKISIVIHTANTNHVIHPQDTGNMLEFNLRMFFNLHMCRHDYDRLIYFGSGAEYDMNHYIPMMDEDYLGEHVPSDPYGFSKYIMANIAEESDNVFELCLFGVYGKYEEWRRRFISNIIYQCMKSDVIKMNHNQIFDYMYVDDLMNILEWFINNTPKHHRYNVCTGKPVELISLAYEIIMMMGKSKELIISDEKAAKQYTGDNTSLLAEIGAYEFIGVKDGIKDMIEFYKDNGFR